MASILVFAPHPDDAELGMGGTIVKLARQGHKVHIVDMTNGEPTPHGSVEIRAKEAEEAARHLSAPDNPVTRLLLGLPNRYVEHAIVARHQVAGVIRAHQAQIVFVPYFEDAHPDHRAVTRIVEDARFDAKLTKVDMPTPPGLKAGPPIYPKWLFYYFATHLRIVPQPSFLVDTTAYAAQKAAAIRAYRSQFEVNEKNRKVVEWVAAEDLYFGSRMGTAAAEPFFTHEPIGLTGLAGLSL